MSRFLIDVLILLLGLIDVAMVLGICLQIKDNEVVSGKVSMVVFAVAILVTMFAAIGGIFLW